MTKGITGAWQYLITLTVFIIDTTKQLLNAKDTAEQQVAVVDTLITRKADLQEQVRYINKTNNRNKSNSSLLMNYISHSTSAAKILLTAL